MGSRAWPSARRVSIPVSMPVITPYRAKDTPLPVAGSPIPVALPLPVTGLPCLVAGLPCPVAGSPCSVGGSTCSVAGSPLPVAGFASSNLQRTRTHRLHAGGVTAISRWLSAATPPVGSRKKNCTLKECQNTPYPSHHKRRGRGLKYGRFKTQHAIKSAADSVAWHGGRRVENRFHVGSGEGSRSLQVDRPVTKPLRCAGE